jgi:hypothetical protein
MKTNLAAILFTLTVASTAYAQPGPQQPPPATADCCTQTEQHAVAQPTLPAVAATQPAGYVPAKEEEQKDEGWVRPPGQRFLHGIRIGWTYIMNFEEKNRTPDEGDDPNQMVSVKEKYGLKTPNMMLIGYEGMYRIVGHSWLNVVMVGNVTVAGLEQSKFIPAASGLIGAEFNEAFQLGVGVNVTPDEDAPTHAIFAAGWTPRVGSIHTPVHFFFAPEPSTNGKPGNHRMGATIGVTW